MTNLESILKSQRHYFANKGPHSQSYSFSSSHVWNVRSMNQRKLEVIKQEMARVNIDILRISKLKWTGMGEFNSDDHYITTVGRNPLEEME